MSNTTRTPRTAKAKAAAAEVKAPKVKAPEAPRFCRCGCGAEVKSNYRPGHDARHVSDLLYALPRRDVDESTATAAVRDALAVLKSTRLTLKFARALESRLADPTLSLVGMVPQETEEA